MFRADPNDSGPHCQRPFSNPQIHPPILNDGLKLMPLTVGQTHDSAFNSVSKFQKSPSCLQPFWNLFPLFLNTAVCEKQFETTAPV